MQAVGRALENLVREWLQTHAGLTEQQARDISEWLAEYEHGSYGRPIHAQSARDHGLNVTDLEADQVLQDLVLSLFHAATLGMQEPTPNGQLIVKMAENHLGTGMYNQALVQTFSVPAGQFPAGFPGIPQMPGSPLLPGNPILIPAGQQPQARPIPGGQPRPATGPSLPSAPAPPLPPAP
jgi:hypothetical protein